MTDDHSFSDGDSQITENVRPSRQSRASHGNEGVTSAQPTVTAGTSQRGRVCTMSRRMAEVMKRQSERDFPCGTTRNGLVDGTKCQAAERKGNLFYLLCIVQTVDGSTKLQKSLRYSQFEWKR